MNKKWFSPGKSTGWSKHDSQKARRANVLRAHKRDLLAATRALQSLANVTQDKETRLKASADALHFFKLYKRQKELRGR